LNPFQTSLERPENSCAATYNLTELERICIEEWDKFPKYRCSKLVVSYPRRLKAVVVANSASTKY
jgi:hypothetical protein